MPFFIALWITVGGFVFHQHKIDLEKEHNTVTLYERTQVGKVTYKVIKKETEETRHGQN
jgi:hypothetical protein